MDLLSDPHFVVAVLVVLQLTLFRGSQVAIPSLYFRTADIVDSPGDLKSSAVAWRLAIPAFAGMVSYLALPDSRYVASAAGAAAWFLIIWPVLWLPKITRHPFRPSVLLLLVVFWVAYALMPQAGFELLRALDGTFDRKEFLLNVVVWPVLCYPVTAVVASIHRTAVEVDNKQEVALALSYDSHPYEGDPGIWVDEAREMLPLAIPGVAVAAVAVVATWLIGSRRA